MFLSYRCVLSFVQTFLCFEEPPKSLNFFFNLNVMLEKKTACMEAKERYILSEVMVSIMYVNF